MIVDGKNDGSNEGLDVDGLNVDGSIVGTSVVGLIVGSEIGAKDGVSVGGGVSPAKLVRVCIRPNKAHNRKALHTIMVEKVDAALDKSQELNLDPNIGPLKSNQVGSWECHPGEIRP